MNFQKFSILRVNKDDLTVVVNQLGNVTYTMHNSSRRNTDQIFSLLQPADALKSILLNQLRYTVYVRQLLETEQAFPYSDSILKELLKLDSSLMLSLACAIEQFAGNVGVHIDEEIKKDIGKIEYTCPPNKMVVAYKASIILNSLESNFLEFAYSFFLNYV